MNHPDHSSFPGVPTHLDTIHPQEMVAFVEQALQMSIDADGHFESDPQDTHPQEPSSFSLDQLIDLEEILERLKMSPQEQFFAQPLSDQFGQRLPFIIATPEVLRLCSHDCTALRDWLVNSSRSGLHPYVPEYLRFFGDLDMARLLQTPCRSWEEACASATVLNQRLALLRSELHQPRVRRHLDRMARPQRRSSTSLRRYIEELFQRYSRLLVIRLDLGYGQGCALNPTLAPPAAMLTSHEELISNGRLPRSAAGFLPFRDIRQHRVDLLGFMRERFGKNFCGYIWKLEYGLQKGYHYHLLLFLNGAQVRKDVVIGMTIGEYWNNHITSGQGVYHNCNAYADQYHSPCIGMMSWNSPGRREGMEHVSNYLAKPDLFVRQDLPRYQRIIGMGWSPMRGQKQDAPRRGRPRKPWVQR